MAYSDLVSLKLCSTGGHIERDIIVQESITVYNLHKVIQFSLNARQTDDGIACKKFVFKHGDKEVKATKTKKLYHVAGGIPECELGTTYKYQCSGDGNSYAMTVSGIATGDARYYVPRCIGGFGGNMDVDATNKKLMLRRFSPAGSNKGPKKLPKVWCPRGTPQSALMPTLLMKMRQPLNTYDDD